MPRALASTVVAVLALAGSAVAASPALEPDWVAWPSSQQIVFTGFGDSGIYVISPSGGRPRLVASANDGPLSISRDGRLVYGKGTSLFTVPLAGGKPRSLGFGFGGVWSPDGKRIAYTSNGGVMVEDSDGHDKRLVASNRYTESTGAPTWSPDGHKLAYVACRAANGSVPCEHQTGFDVYVIGLDGSDKHRVTPTPDFPQCPAWSSIGKLAFSTAVSGDADHPSEGVTAVVKKGGGLRTFRSPWLTCPVWAPNGRRFALATGRGAYLVNFDGSNRKQITVAPGALYSSNGVAWSPDGKWLAIVDGNEHAHLWVVRANGTGLKRLL